MTDNKALRDALNLSLTDISYNSKYIFVTVFYKNTSFNQQNISVTGNNKIPVLRLTLSSGVVTSIQYDTNLTELEWLNRFDNNAPLNFLQPKYEVKTSGIAGGRRSYTNGALFGRAKSQTLRYEYSSSDWNTGSVTIEFLNNSYTSGGGKWVAYKATNLALWYTDELSNTLNYVPTTWPFWLITDSSNPIVIDNFEFGTPPADPSIDLHETCIPSHNIKFSEIYNVINTTTHDGITPISLNNFRSMTIASSARRRGLPANQNYKFNYSEGTNKTISNYNNLIVTNVGSPVETPNLNLPKPHNMNVWPTSNDIDGDGSVIASDPSHAWLKIPYNDISGAGYDWMSGNAGGLDHRYTFSFMMIHNELKRELNIEWKRSSDGVGSDSFYIYELAINSGNNYKNPGTPGNYFAPDNFTSAGDGVVSQDASGIRTTTSEYIVLYYYKSTPNGAGDDRTYIKIRGGETGLVPYNFVDTTPIVLNQDISLNSVTKGKMYAPIKTIKFGNYSPPPSSSFFVASNSLPSYNASGIDNPAGTITFDAGINNTWRLELGSFDFPVSGGGNNMDGQLSIKAGDSKNNYDKVKINGLLNTSGNRSNTNVTGNIDKWFTPGQTVYSGDQTIQQYTSDRVTEVDISNSANNPVFVNSIPLGAAVSQDSPYFTGTLAVAIPAGFTGSTIYILSDINSFEISTTADLSLNTGINSVTIPASDITGESSSIHYTSNGYVIPANNTLAIGTWWSSSGFSVFNYGETGFNKNSYAEWTLDITSQTITESAGVIVTQVNSGNTVTGWLKNSLTGSNTTIVISTSITGIANLDTFVSTENVVVGSTTISHTTINSANQSNVGTGFSQINPIININKRYLEFTYDHNVGNVNYSGTYSGWSITLQRIDSSGSEYNGNYTGTLSYPSLSINKDFRTRCKNPSPILKITEANGIESSGNTITNSSANRINLHLDVSGSRPPRISNDVLYDLSFDDIIASNNTLDISSTFSGMNGTSSFILASIERVGNAPQTITVDVSANTFRNQYGNWNDVSGNDFGKFTWNYS